MKASEKMTMVINGENVEYTRSDCVKNVEPKTLDGMDYCIVRSREDGVKCGYVDTSKIVGRMVTVHQARQIWQYDSTFVLLDIAEHGMRDPEKSKLSATLTNPAIMLEACGVMVCTQEAADQLMAIKAEVK